MTTHPIVRQIIDRDCHVSMSTRAVVRHVISKLRDGYTTFRGMPKADRRRLVEHCVRRHRENLELYGSVMNGGFRHRRSKRISSEKNKLPNDQLSGRELCSLMRKHKVTIEALAFRTGITQKRIRAVRESGLNDALAVRDWLEAITGIDPGPIPEKYRIQNPTEETTCDFCGCPIFQGETAYSYLSEAFCSRHCCRKSLGWN